jgi:creatinine amidohydrolase
MNLADLNWMDVERYLEHDDRIILVTGATEQHGYLSLLTDIKIPLAIASAVAQRENVLVAPPLNFGCSGYFMEYPGTISLTETTFALALMEIVNSLIQHGFRRFLILNGHGGNRMPEELADLQREGEGLRFIWWDWWHSPAVGQIAQEIHLTADHANWLENFPFTRVSEVPPGDKPIPEFDRTDLAGHSVRAILGDGSFGGPYQVDDSVMDRLFSFVVEEAAALVRSI